MSTSGGEGARSPVSRVLEWLGGLELAVLVAALVVVLGSLAFAWLTDEVVEGHAQTLDVRMVRALREPGDPARPIGPWWLPLAARDITALGGGTVLTLVTLAAVAYLLLRSRTSTAALVLAAAGGGQLASAVLKNLVARGRPDIVPHLTEVRSPSFPSGHSMMSAVVYVTLGALTAQAAAQRRVKIYLLVLSLLLTGLIGVSRVYLGVHYPTDVLAGWTAGLAWAAVWLLVAAAVRRRRAGPAP